MKHDLSPIQSEAHINKMRQWFERFSGQAQDSKMYAMLSLQISKDEQLLKEIPDNETQPLPNLFLAAVNYLLAKNPTHELAQFYPNYAATRPVEGLFPAFRAFCFSKKMEIDALMNTRLVQTNEVRRCTLLLPAVALISMRTKGSPLHLIDIGTSSGLNLLMDQYRIRYSDGSCLGREDASVDLECEIKGKLPFDLKTPAITTRTGIDLNPIDLADEDEFHWALSLIWPDQLDRIERFKKAVAVLRTNKPTLKKGSGLEQLEPAMEIIPVGSSVCVMHSFTLNQFSQEERFSFEKQLAQASFRHDIWRISLEWLGTKTPELTLEHYVKGGKRSSERIASCHQHGAWIQWVIN